MGNRRDGDGEQSDERELHLAEWFDSMGGKGSFVGGKWRGVEGDGDDDVTEDGGTGGVSGEVMANRRWLYRADRRCK